MLQIQKDPELYEHYTTGNVDTLLPALANISQYITNEKILERRPTIDSLTELDNIILNLNNEQDKKTYVENSFKKAEALIANFGGLREGGVLVLMMLLEKLNILYTVVNNSYSKDSDWHNQPGLWKTLEPYFNQIKAEFEGQDLENIIVNVDKNKIFSIIEDKLINSEAELFYLPLTFHSAHITDAPKNKEDFCQVIINGVEDFEIFYLSDLPPLFNKTPKENQENAKELYVFGLSCSYNNIDAEGKLNENIKSIGFSYEIMDSLDSEQMIWYSYLVNNKIIPVDFLKSLSRGEGATKIVETSTSYKASEYHYYDEIYGDTPFHISKLSTDEFSSIKTIGNFGPSVYYFHVKPLN